MVFDKSKVTSVDWVTYPIMRFLEIPERINVTLLDLVGTETLCRSLLVGVQPALSFGEVEQGHDQAPMIVLRDGPDLVERRREREQAVQAMLNRHRADRRPHRVGGGHLDALSASAPVDLSPG